MFKATEIWYLIKLLNKDNTEMAKNIRKKICKNSQFLLDKQ